MTGYAFERPDGEQSRRMLWAIMVGMFVLGVLVIVVFKPSLKHKKHGHIDQLRADAMPSPVPGAPAPAALSGNPPTISAPIPVVVTPAGSAQKVETAPIPAPAPTAAAAAVSNSESAAPVPSPTPPAVKAVVVNPVAPVPSPSPSEKTKPAPVASAAPIAVNPTPTVTNRADLLQNGSDYEPGTVKHKFIFKALADVVVQYRCDDKSLMRFTLRKDRILVLRGKDGIRLQVSNPKSIAVSLGSKGYIPLADARRTFTFNDTATFVHPIELKDKMAEKWDGAVPLEETPDPVAEAATGTETAPEKTPEPALSPTP